VCESKLRPGPDYNREYRSMSVRGISPRTTLISCGSVLIRVW
jgi:hypothetical protein